MIQTTFGFNLNNLSAKKAGSVYSSLAKNSAAKAEVAGKNKRTMLSESNMGFGMFQRYLNAANSTLQQVSNVKSNANNILTQQYRREQATTLATYGQAARIEGNNARQFQAVGDAVTSLMRSGNALAASMAKADLTQGMIDAAKKESELNTLAQTDPHAALKQTEEFLTEFQTDKDNAYLQGQAPKMFKLYKKFNDEVQQKDLETNLISYAALVENKKFITGNRKGLDKFREDYGKVHNIPIDSLRDMEYNVFNSTYAIKASKANSMSELQNITTSYMKDKKTYYDSSFFLRSRSSGIKAMLTKADKQYNDALKIKLKAFKAQGEHLWNQILDNPDMASPAIVNQALDYRQLSPKERRNEEVKLGKVNQQHSVDKMFMDAFDVTSSDAAAYWDYVSPEVKKNTENIIGLEVTNAMLNPDSTASMNRLENILKTQEGHLGKVEDSINLVLNSGTAQDKQRLYNSIRTLTTHSYMSNSLSQTLTDDTFARIFAAGVLVDMKDTSTEDKLEKAWDDALSQTAKQPSSEATKLTYSTKEGRTLLDNVDEDGLSMGLNKGRFKSVITSIYNKVGSVDPELYTKIRTYFDNQQKTVELKGTDGYLYKATEYTSFAPDPFASLQEDIQDETKMLVLDQIRANAIKEGKPFNFSYMVYLPGKRVAFIDAYGATVKTADLSSLIPEMSAIAQAEDDATVSTKEALEFLGQDSEVVMSYVLKKYEQNIRPYTLIGNLDKAAQKVSEITHNPNIREGVKKGLTIWQDNSEKDTPKQEIAKGLKKGLSNWSSNPKKIDDIIEGLEKGFTIWRGN